MENLMQLYSMTLHVFSYTVILHGIPFNHLLPGITKLTGTAQ